jgi:hypothetical protein
MYQYQEHRYRIDRVYSINEHNARKRAFLNSSVGKAFQEYKLEKWQRLHGLDYYFVDGHALNAGQVQGDIDYTMGGHGYRYLYIPSHEIWIDKRIKNTHSMIPTSWHEYTERPLMAYQNMRYSDAHEIAANFENVLLDGKYFVLPVGTYRQSAPGMCGPASLKIYMDFLRWPILESYIAKKCKMIPNDGTTPESMIKAAQELKFIASEKQNYTVDEVKETIRSGFPIIANHQAEPKLGEGHYAVIIGFTKTEFVLSDPSEDEGYVVTPIKTFMDKWYELEDETTRQGIILDIP